MNATPGFERIAGLLSLQGSVAMVTGASGGIGSAVARMLGDAGARVAGVDLPGAAALESIDMLRCDVADRGSVTELFRQFRARFDRLDVLVHCAGIARDGVLWKMDDADWSAVMQTNLDSAFYLAREAVPMLRSGGGGSIVLISSINAERGKFGQANYAASKAGLMGFGRAAARETGKFGIRVNVVAPGMIDTPMTAALSDDVRRQAVAETALGHLGRPEDVARAVLFLVAPMSAHITGQVLRVDGGQLMA